MTMFRSRGVESEQRFGEIDTNHRTCAMVAEPPNSDKRRCGGAGCRSGMPVGDPSPTVYPNRRSPAETTSPSSPAQNGVAVPSDPADTWVVASRFPFQQLKSQTWWRVTNGKHNQLGKVRYPLWHAMRNQRFGKSSNSTPFPLRQGFHTASESQTDESYVSQNQNHNDLLYRRTAKHSQITNSVGTHRRFVNNCNT